MDLKFDASKVEGFKGSAVFPLMKYRDRMKAVKSIGFKFGADGEAVVDDSQIDSLLKMVDMAAGAVKKLEITHLESGEIAKSFDELESSPVFDPVITELASFYLNAGQVGKN